MANLASWPADQERRLEAERERHDASLLAWAASANAWRPRQRVPQGASPTVAGTKRPKSYVSTPYFVKL